METAILQVLPKYKWPQVGVISNSILQSVGKENLIWAEKTDGQHFNLAIQHKTVYDITDPREMKELFQIDYDGIAVLDTELYKGKYYIFDAAMVGAKNLTALNFKERLGAVEPIMKQLGDKFILKKFFSFGSVKELSDFILNDISPDTGNEIDGVVLQRTDLPYYCKEPTCYKMKPRYLHTVDFRMKYCPEESVYYLYLIGFYNEFLYNLQRLPRDNRYQLVHTGVNTQAQGKLPNSFEFLFSTPSIAGLHYYRNDGMWNTTGFAKRHIDDVNQHIRALNISPEAYDGKIVEMCLTESNKWVPLRIREDKVTPNGYKIGLSNVAQVFDPLVEPEEHYFSKTAQLSTATTNIQNVIHRVNYILRQYLAERWVNTLCRNINLIDLCGGRGADERNLFACGVVNLFAIDADRTALHQYLDRSLFLRNNLKTKPYTALTKEFVPNKTGNLFSLNILNYTLGERSEYGNIMEDLMTRYEWTRLEGKGNKKANIVLMNFAIHYLCGKPQHLTYLGDFITSVLRDDGRFIVTYYDGDKILDYIKKGESVGPFNIEIVSDTRDVVIAKMPMPTIQSGEDFYREEPLVLERVLVEHLEKHLTLEATGYLFNDALSYIPKEYIGLPVCEYIKLIKYRIYKVGKVRRTRKY